ncbi:helix-turn-helix domain-containing protein [uncultured Aquimarina sp.]|uniref:helix-turn-helix domain-containing protein n=1 Tax=uncultured Aquimarina sp. TaxID=575652 RepID=UPI002605E2AE|nr:helix-turn-helix domain-containing protein [uncultured Aquimarina sp.]
MIKSYFSIVLYIVFVFFQNVNAQNDELSKDSLTTKSYLELSKGFDQYKKDIDISKRYATAFLVKAKTENNIIKQADGYYMLAKIVDKSEKLKYTDSIIDLTRELEDYTYPAEAHLYKAGVLGSLSRYEKAMDELVVANRLAHKNNNIDQKFKIDYYIALLKNNLGEYGDALKIFKTYKDYYEKLYQNDERNKVEYIKSLFALGDSYNKNKKYDSASYINYEAIRLSLDSKDSILYDRLLVSSGITDYYKREYKSSIDTLNKFQNLFYNKIKSDGTLIRSDLYLGKVFFAKNNIKKAIEYYRKVDSTVFARKHFYPDILDPYSDLIKYYKSNGDVEKQLFYINRLLKVDSILDNNFKNVYQKINRNYSTPNLLSEKQAIIDSLKQNSQNRNIIIVVLGVLSFALLLFLYFNNKKKKTYQRRFQEVFEQTKEIEEVAIKPEPKKEVQDIGISEEIIIDILKKLSIFEEKQEFLQPNITVSSLSKDLKTNSKYLSKTINFYKQKSFSNYINDLRIHFVVERLKSDTKFRKYTIKAIANEIGFNTTEAFSKSFYKTTGIYPSFFLKQLEKKEVHK